MSEIKKVKCPFCGSDAIDFGTYDTEWDSDLSMICTWSGECCDCHEGFIISEVLEVTDRMVARDSQDLDDQLHPVGKRTEHNCPKCGNPIHENRLYDPNEKEGVRSYPYICPVCDENFYETELE